MKVIMGAILGGAFLALLAIIMVRTTSNSYADSITIGAVVPLVGARAISEPRDKSISMKRIITVKGDCGNASFVEIYRNGLSGGSTRCHEGHFSLSLTLLAGMNVLLARVESAQAESGLDSSPIQVSYTPLPSKSVVSLLQPSASFQFLMLYLNLLYQGAR